MVSTVQELQAKLNRTSGTQPGGLRAATQGSNPEEITSRIMSKDSPLMQRARATGLQFGAQRGMLNSSLSVGAAEAAAYDFAVPLAQQESAENTQKSIASADRAAATQRAQMEIDARERISQNEIVARRDELELQQGFQSEQNQLDRDLQTLSFDREREMLDVRIAADRDIAELDAASRRQLALQEEAMRTRLQNSELEANRRTDAANAAANAHQMYEEGYRTIMNNPDIGAAERAELIQNKGETLNLQLAMFEDLYGVDLNWAGDGVSGPPRDPEPIAPEVATSQGRGGLEQFGGR